MKAHHIAHYKPETIRAIKRVRGRISTHISKRLRGARSVFDVILNGYIENVFLIYDHPFDVDVVEDCVRDEDSLVEYILQSNVKHYAPQDPFDASYIKEGFRMYQALPLDLSTSRSQEALQYAPQDASQDAWQTNPLHQDDSQYDSQYESQDASQYASQDASQYASQDASQYASPPPFSPQFAAQCLHAIEQLRTRSEFVPDLLLPLIIRPDDRVMSIENILVFYNDRCKYVKLSIRLPKHYIPARKPRLIARVLNATQTLVALDGNLYLFDGDNGYVTEKYHGVVIKYVCAALNLPRKNVRSENMIALKNFLN